MGCEFTEKYRPVKEPLRLVCIKIGGRAATDEHSIAALMAEIAELSSTTRFVLVHGGGAEVTRVSQALGYTPTFRDGVRMTSAAEMEVVDMVLSGLMNKRLVRRFRASGVAAAGISGSDGGLFEGARLDESTHTGRVERVDTRLLELLIEGSYLPVVASTSTTAEGVPLNINADEAAFSIAAALPSDVLVFLSDTPGILSKDGMLLDVLDERSVGEKIADGTITGGMIPKVRASLDALRSGVGSIIVGQYTVAGELRNLLDGKIGTRVVLSSDRG